MSPLQQKVYELIVRRFLSIFYPAAEYQTLKLVIQIDKESLFTSAKVLKSLGFLEVMGKTLENAEDENNDTDKAEEQASKARSQEIAGFGRYSENRRSSSGKCFSDQGRCNKASQAIYLWFHDTCHGKRRTINRG